MKILVVEDKEMHRRSAEETLAGHEVTIVESFDEAIKLMDRRIDKENVQRLLIEMGFPTRPDSKDKDRWDAYWRANDEAKAKSVVSFPFEVVLTDMMMPMSATTLAPGVFNPGEQVPYGFIIALKATLRGAKFVAMVTDTNHHEGAMSAAMDHLGRAYYHNGFRPNFVVNGATVMFVHTPFVIDVVRNAPCDYCKESPGHCSACDGTGNHKYTHEACFMCSKDVGRCSNCRGTTRADKEVLERKDWGQVLKDLISDSHPVIPAE